MNHRAEPEASLLLHLASSGLLPVVSWLLLLDFRLQVWFVLSSDLVFL